MTTLTRRTLLAAGGIGAAGLAIAGCGTADDPRAEADDAGLLADALAAELALAAAYAELARQGGEAGQAGREFAAAQRDRIGQLEERGETTGEDAGGAEAEAPAGAPLESASTAAEAAIAAYREAAGLLSARDDRALAVAALAQIAADLAALRGLAGEQQVPSAFVVGASG